MNSKYFTYTFILLLSCLFTYFTFQKSPETEWSKLLKQQNIRISSDLYDDVVFHRNKLYGRDFKFLEETLHALHENSMRSQEDEFKFKAFIKGITNVLPHYESLYDEWITLYPNSVSGYWLKCHASKQLAFAYRGRTRIREMHPDQWEAMRLQSYDAFEACRKALEYDPSFSPIYEDLIAISRLKGDQQYRRLLLNQILENAKNPLYVLSTYLETFLDKWGGAVIDITYALESYAPLIEQRPGYRPYLGYADYYEANKLWSAEKYEEAKERVLDIQNQYGKSAVYLAELADSENRLGNTNQAIQYYKKEIMFDPFNAEIYRTLAAKSYKNDLQLAKSYLDMALLLEPINHRYLTFRANLYNDYLDQKALAKQDYDLALYRGPYNHETRYKRGKYYLNFVQNYPESEKDLKVAFDLRPNNTSYVHKYALVLYRQNKCESRMIFDAMLKLCDIQKCSNEKLLNWVNNEAMPRLEQICTSDK